MSKTCNSKKIRNFHHEKNSVLGTSIHNAIPDGFLGNYKTGIRLNCNVSPQVLKQMGLKVREKKEGLSK